LKKLPCDSQFTLKRNNRLDNCLVSYENLSIRSGREHTLHEFGINVPPGYKMTVTPQNLIYLPIDCDEISTLSISIVDQKGDLVNLRGENVSIRVHIRLIE